MIIILIHCLVLKFTSPFLTKLILNLGPNLFDSIKKWPGWSMQAIHKPCPSAAGSQKAESNPRRHDYPPGSEDVLGLEVLLHTGHRLAERISMGSTAMELPKQRDQGMEPSLADLPTCQASEPTY